MKNFLLAMLSLLLCCSFAFAEVPFDRLDALSEIERSSLLAQIEIEEIARDVGLKSAHRFDALDLDLSDLSAEELQQIKESLNSKDPAGGIEKFIEALSLDVYDKPLAENDITYLVYETICDLSDGLEYTVQNHNPEIEFNQDTQTVHISRLYLTYFGECTKDSAKERLEDYSEKILAGMRYAFPNTNMEVVYICWKVPSVNEDSLYAATYWCENEDGTIALGEGEGFIYQ